ncbi:unnamed protein product [Clonostachys rhizophaga]|uniref:Uncharacterized protein n=1 Tax=Clonostachys rhizophaga TaxID=160324 RepID=A0A9N9VPI2_9HYPO|nr:unnamed protein product [Clonostachys rhizophaga]
MALSQSTTTVKILGEGQTRECDAQLATRQLRIQVHNLGEALEESLLEHSKQSQSELRPPMSIPSGKYPSIKTRNRKSLASIAYRWQRKESYSKNPVVLATIVQTNIQVEHMALTTRNGYRAYTSEGSANVGKDGPIPKHGASPRLRSRASIRVRYQILGSNVEGYRESPAGRRLGTLEAPEACVNYFGS